MHLSCLIFLGSCLCLIHRSSLIKSSFCRIRLYIGVIYSFYHVYLTHRFRVKIVLILYHSLLIYFLKRSIRILLKCKFEICFLQLLCSQSILLVFFSKLIVGLVHFHWCLYRGLVKQLVVLFLWDAICIKLLRLLMTLMVCWLCFRPLICVLLFFFFVFFFFFLDVFCRLFWSCLSRHLYLCF